MVKIRLTRTGKKHEPHYRIVAVDSRAKGKGAYIEKIGYYNPRTKPSTVEFDKDILQKWLDRGAQMTDTVHDILAKHGAVKPDKLRTVRIKTRIKRLKQLAKDQQKEQVTPEAPKEEKKDTPAPQQEEKVAPETPQEEKKDAPQPTEEPTKTAKPADVASKEEPTDKNGS